MEPTDPARLEAELLARIAEDPASDAPRLVLADFYVQRGDPRGELMALQLSTPTGRYKTKLEKLHRELRRAMAGSLAEILEEKSIEIRRGRLYAAETKFTHNAQRSLARGNILWATVEELATDDAALVCDPAMRSLRVVDGLGIGAFVAVCTTDRPLPIERLVLKLGSPAAGTLDDRAVIGRTAVLPELRVLELEYLETSERMTAERLAWLLTSPLGQQLDEVAIRGFSVRTDSRLEIDEASFTAFRRQWPRPLRFRFS